MLDDVKAADDPHKVLCSNRIGKSPHLHQPSPHESHINLVLLCSMQHEHNLVHGQKGGGGDFTIAMT